MGGMFRNLHPIVEGAVFVAFVEIVFAPVGGDLYANYLRGPLKMMADYLSSFGFLPHGLLIGGAVGAILTLYFLRGRAPDWYKTFDIRQARYDHENISVSTLVRAYVRNEKYEFVRGKEFYNCHFYGPRHVLHDGQ